MLRHTWQGAAALAWCFLFAGCQQSLTLQRYAGAPAFAPTTADDVQILRTAPAGRTVRLGELRAVVTPVSPLGAIEDEMRRKAAELGAHAVVMLPDAAGNVGSLVPPTWYGADGVTGRTDEIVGVAIRYER